MNELDNKQSPLRELALFAGAGGGILGGHLLGWRTVCAVEWEAYPRAVLRARMVDGQLPFFPILEDVQHICFDSTAKVIYDNRYYEVRQTKEGLSESGRNVCGRAFHFRGCTILRKNTPSDVGVDEGKKHSNEAKHKTRKRKSFFPGREKVKRSSSKHTGISHQKGDSSAANILRAMWRPWEIQGWEDSDSSSPPGLQRSIAGNVAMSKMPPRMAQEIQSNREEIIDGEADRIAYIGDIDVVSGGFP